MIVRTVRHPQWLSNSFVVADRRGGEGVVIDTGGPAEELLAAIDELDATITHVINTHYHPDHTAANDAVREETGAPLCVPADETSMIAGAGLSLSPGDGLESGSLEIRALALPGHTRGQIGLLVDDEAVFTADCLFRGSVGGTLSAGQEGFDAERDAIMETLMGLDRDVRVYPGHSEATTIGREWEENQFIRVWRQVDGEGREDCRVGDRSGRLIVWASDYDDGYKAWVRFRDGTDAIVPGSKVRRE